jgi:hypothetical protein
MIAPSLLDLAGRNEALRRELGRFDARVADACLELHRPGANIRLVAEHLKWLRDRRRRVVLELDVLAEEAAALLGRDVARDPGAEPCPASPN